MYFIYACSSCVSSPMSLSPLFNFMTKLQAIYNQRFCPILSRRKYILDRVSQDIDSTTCVSLRAPCLEFVKLSMKLIAALPLAFETRNDIYSFVAETVYRMLRNYHHFSHLRNFANLYIESCVLQI